VSSTDLALVLRRFDYGESSQTARLFSRALGRLNVLAKGIKRPRSSLRGPMDLFALAEVEISVRPRSGLHLLTSHRVVTGLPGLRRNLERLCGAYYVTEILREGTRDLDPSRPLFDAALATLRTLESARAAEVPLAVAWFELAFLELSGFAPQWEACATCGRRAPEGAPVRFASWRGGVVCRQCLAERPAEVVVLGTGLRAVLQQILGAAGPSESAGLKVSAADRRALRELLVGFLQGVMERELRAAAFLAP